MISSAYLLIFLLTAVKAGQFEFDPIYSTYLGNINQDDITSAAFDESKTVLCVNGATINPEAIPTENNEKIRWDYQGEGDIFIMCVNVTSGELVYTTFLGGEDTDFYPSVLINTGGSEFTLAFSTYSPFNNSQFYGVEGSCMIQVASFNLELGYLDSWVISGSGYDEPFDIAVGNGGLVYLVGTTLSEDFPATSNALQPDYPIEVVFAGFLAIHNSSNLIYCTFLGNSPDVSVRSVAAGYGKAFVLVWTNNMDQNTSEPSPFLSDSNYMVLYTFNSTGEFISSKFLWHHADDTTLRIAIASNGYYFLVATAFGNAFDFMNVSSSYESIDIYIIKMNNFDDTISSVEVLSGDAQDTVTSCYYDSINQKLVVTGIVGYKEGFPITDGAYIGLDTSLNTEIGFVTIYDANTVNIEYSSFISIDSTTSNKPIVNAYLFDDYLWTIGQTNGYPLPIVTPTTYQDYMNSSYSVFILGFQQTSMATTGDQSVATTGSFSTTGGESGFVTTGEFITTSASSTTGSGGGADICPAQVPYRCPSGTCVNNTLYCIIPTCPSNQPFRCSAMNAPLVCASSPSECLIPNNSTNCTFQCWDSTCVESQSRCRVLPACPAFFKRCLDGTCATWNSTCPNTNTCASGQFRCPTGGPCVTSLSNCPPYDGCNAYRPYQCLDRLCGLSSNDCLCGITNLFSCSDGTCAATCTTQAKDIKPIEVQVTLDLQRNNTIPIVGATSIGTMIRLASLVIPTGTFENTQTSSITVRPISDSILRATRHPSWTTSEQRVIELFVSIAIDIEIDSSISEPFAQLVEISLIASPVVSNQTVCVARLNEELNIWECLESTIKEYNPMDQVWIVRSFTNRFSKYTALIVNQDNNPPQDDSETKPEEEGSSATVIIIVTVICAVIIIGIAILFGVRYFRKQDEEIDRKLTLNKPSVSLELN